MVKKYEYKTGRHKIVIYGRNDQQERFLYVQETRDTRNDLVVRRYESIVLS